METVDLGLVATRLANSSVLLHGLKAKKRLLRDRLGRLKDQLNNKINGFDGKLREYFEPIGNLKYNEHERSLQLSDNLFQYLNKSNPSADETKMSSVLI